ncbi:MAG: glycosyltransferase [Actinomycetota bacterium]|nr:glycosyltransferase [Actinomycetota bacterium]
MRIALVATGDATRDPRIRVLSRTLRDVGHDVTLVCGGTGEGPDESIRVVRVPGRYPKGLGRIGWAARRIQPSAMRDAIYRSKLATATTATNPDIVYATSPASMEIAKRAAGASTVVARLPEWGSAGPRDMVALATHDQRWSESPAGPGIGFHTDADDRAPWFPEPDRYRGRRVLLAYRRTETTPGRYLERGLERAGFTIDHCNDVVDWDEVDPETDFAVFVESPHPAIEVRGSNPGVPVLFWAHHGDHSTPVHVRLTRRYGAHAVLLAHSWHLAHRFPVPIHRFPFGVPSELLDPSVPWNERPYDVGFVGAQIRREGGTYARRQQLVAAIEEGIPEKRRCMESAVDAHRLAEIYANSKTVFNEGGVRHFPITMRVFEAIGSGSLLVTDDIPGTDALFEPGKHYEILDDSIVDQVERLAADPRTGERAAAALEFSKGRHDYDHRIDELVAIADAIDPIRDRPVSDKRSLSPLGRLIDADAIVHGVAAMGIPNLVDELPWRAVWTDVDRQGGRGPNRFDAVAIGPDWIGDLETPIQSAIRFVYAQGSRVDEIVQATAQFHGEHIVERDEDLIRIDLLAEGYRVFPDGHRLAR